MFRREKFCLVYLRFEHTVVTYRATYRTREGLLGDVAKDIVEWSNKEDRGALMDVKIID